MGKLINGEWVKQPSFVTAGAYQRKDSEFRNQIRADGSTAYTPADDRYHLYVSYACPWAHRTLIARGLLGLGSAISFSVTDAFMGDDGWTLPVDADPLHNARLLSKVYVAAQGDYTGRVTVPVLWDKQTDGIVNNESLEILRMFGDEFDHNGAWNLWPADTAAEVDAMIAANYNTINNGVYRCGFAGDQAAYDQAIVELFERLDACEQILGRQRYLCGDTLTAADICLFTTLYRFDAVYYFHFRCNVRRLSDYANLWAYTRDIYQTPGVADTCRMDHIREHYYTSHESISPQRIIPAAAPPDFSVAHGRG